jgi:hypothetical protein
VNGDDAQTQGREFIGVAPLPPLDPEMCRVFFLAVGAGTLAVALGWGLLGVAAVLFGLLALWLAAHLAAAPTLGEEEVHEA